LKDADGKPIYRTRQHIHAALGLEGSGDLINSKWLAKADELGIPRARAWEIALDCMEGVTRLLLEGQELVEAVATVDPIGQIEREAGQGAEQQEG
jgi:hypothetical protein